MSLNKIVGTLAIGGAAYLLRNKDSRTKAIEQIKTIVTPETIEKIKSQFQSLANQTLKGNPDQTKLLEPLSEPAFPDYTTPEKEKVGAGRPNEIHQ